MKIIRSISSTHPEKCHMVAKGLFGNVKGEVKYADYGIQSLNNRNGYFVIVKGDCKGAATDFISACNMLLEDLGIVQTKCV